MKNFNNRFKTLNTIFWVIFGFVVVFMVASVIMNINGAMNGESGVSFGISGMVETRCIGGYQYTIGSAGIPIQTIGANGFGVPCGK